MCRGGVGSCQSIFTESHSLESHKLVVCKRIKESTQRQGDHCASWSHMIEFAKDSSSNSTRHSRSPSKHVSNVLRRSQASYRLSISYKQRS
jgi:hypothetical protein